MAIINGSGPTHIVIRTQGHAIEQALAQPAPTPEDLNRIIKDSLQQEVQEILSMSGGGATPAPAPFGLDSLGNLINQLLQPLRDIPTAIRQMFGAAWSFVLSLPGRFDDAVRAGLAWIFQRSLDILGIIMGWGARLRAGAESVARAAIGFLTERLIPFFIGLLSPVLVPLANFLNLITAPGRFILDLIVLLSREGLPGVVRRLQATTAQAIVTGQGLITQYLLPRMNDAQRTFWDLYGLIPRNTGLEPSGAFGMVAPALLLAFGAGFAAHGTATALEFIPYFKELGFNQVAGFMAEFGGFGPVIRATHGTLLRTAMETPLRHQFLRDFRPTVPGIGNAVDMRLERRITDREFRSIIALWGWPDLYIDALEEQMWFDGHTRDLILIADTDVVDWDWIEQKIREQGWEERDVPKVKAALMQRSTQHDRDEFIRAADKGYKEGFINPAAYDAMLSGAGKTEEQRQWRRRALDIQRFLELADDQIRTAEEDYSDGRITIEQLVDRLTGAGLGPDRAGSRARLADAKKFKPPKPPRVPPEAPAQRRTREILTQTLVITVRRILKDLTALVREELITEQIYLARVEQLIQSATQRLIEIGVDPSLAAATLELELARAGLEVSA